MQWVFDFFKRPDVLVGLIVGVAATLAAPWVPRAIKTVLLFFPKRIGAGFNGAFKHFQELLKAKADPVAATVYVGQQLSQLTINVALGLVSFFIGYVLLTLNAEFVRSYRTPMLVLDIFAFVLFAGRAAMRALALRLVYEYVI